MIVVIAPEKDIENEIEILIQLFEAGLEYYHFRKPDKSYDEHVAYLNQIPKEYHKNIVPHYFHELINEFDLKGIHFQEQKRIDALENGKEYFLRFSNMQGKTISSSFHEPEVLANCNIEFDYHLLSPVFSSISKEGYKGRGFDVNDVDKTIIGMGGINENTIGETIKLGFKGIGILGGVWNAESPVTSFIKIKEQYNQFN